MDGWMDVLITLQCGCNSVGQSEVSADSGTDSCAVQGASTFVRPERTTGLRTHSQTASNERQAHEKRVTVENLLRLKTFWLIDCWMLFMVLFSMYYFLSGLNF